MTNTKHTPTPWWHTQSGIVVGDGRIITDCQESAPFDDMKANAEFIVRAVNVHDELVAALMDLHPSIINDKLRERIGALIIKARGEIKPCP